MARRHRNSGAVARKLRSSVGAVWHRGMDALVGSPSVTYALLKMGPLSGPEIWQIPITRLQKMGGFTLAAAPLSTAVFQRWNGPPYLNA